MANTKIRKAVFPVGGLGIRFLPATKSMPKEMLTIIDKPLIQYAVEEAKAAGIDEFIFITGRGKTLIEDHFDFSYELNGELEKKGNKRSAESINDISIEPGKLCYVRQQAPLGLGHAVWCAREFVGDEPFAVILADDFIISKTPCLSQMIHEYKGGNMVAALDVPHAETGKYGILDIATAESKLLTAHSDIEKPAPAEAPSTKAIIGRYILDPKIFNFLGRQARGTGGEVQLTDSLKEMLPETPLSALEFDGKRFDCGSKNGLLKANIAAALNRPDMASSVREILTDYNFFKDKDA